MPAPVFYRSFVFAVVFNLALLIAPASGQSVSGAITGLVVDSSGGAIAGARVTLTSERTADARNATTNEDGGFQFVAVQPGVYTIRVEARGFRAFERRNTNLTASEQLALGKIELTVGEVTESVTTVAEGATVETESAENSALLTANQIEQISVKGRDVVNLLRLVPGVAYGDDIDSLGSGFGTSTPNIGGARNTFNTFSVDGVPGNDMGSPQFNSGSVNLDAIAEVKVQLNNYRAESGRSAGALVKVVTKSGTSQFHGSGYWYKRHEQFNARNFFNNLLGLPKPLYRFDTAGFTIGGPVIAPKLYAPDRKKLFFFYSFEYSHTVTPQPIRQVTVPTGLERAGDFSQSLDQNNRKIFIKDPLLTAPCNITTGVGGGCFPDNKIPANRLSAAGQALFKVFPLPNALDRTVTRGTYNYNFQESIDVPKNNHLLRVDYKLSEKDSFYVRGSRWYADNQGFAVGAGGSNWGLVKSHYTFRDDGVTANWIHIFNPRLVNEAQVGVRHGTELGSPTSDEELARVQRVRSGFNVGQFFPQFNPLGIIPQATFGVPGSANITYDGRYPLRGADTFITFDDNATYTLGAHTIKAGLYVERLRNYEGESGSFAGRFTFTRDANNPLDSNYAYSNALLGVFQTYTESNTRPSNEGRAWTIEWYAQDVWKATRRLTLESGMRFVWFTHWRHIRGDASAFALERYDRGRAPRLYEPALVGGQRRGRDPLTGAIVSPSFIGLIVPGSGDIVNGMASEKDDNYPDGFKNQAPALFEPRLGFGYNLRGDGKTALRGGFGVFHNTRPPGGTLRQLTLNPPTQFNPTIYYGTFDSLLSSTGIFAPSNVRGQDRNAKTPVIYNWTFGIQQDLGFNTILGVSYNGSRSNFLLQSRNINLVPYGARFQNPDPTLPQTPVPRFLNDNFFRPYPGYGAINFHENASSSNYHALQAQANRRFSRGLQFGVAYTYSKTMDLTDTDGGNVATYRPNRIWNYGKAGFDQTHIFVFNYTWDLPRLSRVVNHPVVKFVFDNWQLSGTTSFVSGRPSGVSFSTVDGQDITGGGDGARVVILGKAQLDGKKEATLANGALGTVQWINPTAFGRPKLGDFGNAPKDVFRLPGVNNWDMSFFKNFPFFSEKRRLQLRWEIYNLFNHAQFNAVDSAARFDASGAQVNTRFGQVTQARPARVMQGSLRFTY